MFWLHLTRDWFFRDMKLPIRLYLRGLSGKLSWESINNFLMWGNNSLKWKPTKNQTNKIQEFVHKLHDPSSSSFCQRVTTMLSIDACTTFLLIYAKIFKCSFHIFVLMQVCVNLTYSWTASFVQNLNLTNDADLHESRKYFPILR